MGRDLNHRLLLLRIWQNTDSDGAKFPVSAEEHVRGQTVREVRLEVFSSPPGTAAAKRTNKLNEAEIKTPSPSR